MGIAIGVALITLTIASFVVVNLRAGRMMQRYNDQWTVDPQTGQPVPPQHGQGHQHGGGQHGGGQHGGGDAGGGGHHH
jgi:hypothetical protein